MFIGVLWSSVMQPKTLYIYARTSKTKIFNFFHWIASYPKLGLFHIPPGSLPQEDTTPEADRSWAERRPAGSHVTYQASSPDEVALVSWSETVGLALTQRDLNSMQLQCTQTGLQLHYRILQIFPFTSETKRMGIIVQNEDTGEANFLKDLKCGGDVQRSSLSRTCSTICFLNFDPKETWFDIFFWLDDFRHPFALQEFVC